MFHQTASAASSSSNRRWRRKPLHTVVAIVLCATTFHMIILSWDDNSSSQLDDFDDKRRQLAYFDTVQMKPVPYGRHLIDPNFQSLIYPTDIDGGMFKKQAPEDFEAANAVTAKGGGGESSTTTIKKWSACEDILLFMPYPFAHSGHGSQLNSFMLASLVATYTNRAMVILEPPNQLNAFKSNSQFGCPPEAWMTEVRRTGAEPVKVGWNKDFPVGMTRLIRHPSWLSRGCSLPCIDEYTYEEWDALRTKDTENALEPHQIQCNSSGGDDASTTINLITTNVVVMGGEEVRQFFITHYKDQMLDRSTTLAITQAYDWSMRLGAKPHEASVFSNATLGFDTRDKWDYISALLARSGILRFQPWIGRDVEDFMKKYVPDLNLNEPYDAIHVRRGDKIYSEAKRHVRYYWQEQGQYDEETGAIPKDYIPFTQYLIQYETITKCLDGPRTVYVSTDDPAEVKSEIDDMPKDDKGYTLLMTNGGELTCHKFRFIFSTYDQKLLSKDAQVPEDDDKKASTGMIGSSPFHLQDDPVKRSCEDRYERNIASISDLMLLAKSNVAVVEYNSNWGRLVRLFRLRLNDTPRILNGARPVLQKGELKIAWGKKLPGPPGY